MHSDTPGKAITEKPHPPTPEQIIALRKQAGLTQTECARLVYSELRTWQYWENGARKMHPALWELFEIKTATIIDIKNCN